MNVHNSYNKEIVLETMQITDTMRKEADSRTEQLIGTAALERLHKAHVCLFGVGGVGGYAAEALVRAGVGEITLVDPDTVALSNINRQIIALTDNIGMYKTEAAGIRLSSIRPDCIIHERRCFYLPENAGDFDFAAYDYIIDAVDTVTAKLSIVEEALRAGTPVISAMGTGNKIDAGQFVVTDIYKTNTCPLAAVMRRELKKRGVKHLKVVYSPVPPIKPIHAHTEHGKIPPASISFVPPVCGLLAAGEVIRDLIAGIPRTPNSVREETE